MIHERSAAGGRITLSTIPTDRRLFAKRPYDRQDRIVMAGAAVGALFMAAAMWLGWL